MLSEWLVDKPLDFESDWLAVMAPIGRRSLIVSARGSTHAYSRAGALINRFPSLLPGGCQTSHRNNSDYCILDCVFDEGAQTYYILDVMCWRGNPVYDSDTEFRVFWKEQKFVEFSDEISTYSRTNPLPFRNLAFHECSRESLERLLAETPPFQVDGILFIHKQCRYIIGRSPLTLWLKPHMVPDLLEIPVSAEFLAQSPAIAPKRTKEKMDTSGESRRPGGSHPGGKEEEEEAGGTGQGKKGRKNRRSGKRSDMDVETELESVGKPSLGMETK